MKGRKLVASHIYIAIESAIQSSTKQRTWLKVKILVFLTNISHYPELFTVSQVSRVKRAGLVDSPQLKLNGVSCPRMGPGFQ